MRIAVAGGTGTVGAHVVALARAAGHEPLVLSRSHGVDLAGSGDLDLAGVDVVIDASGVQATSAEKSRAFFRAVTERLLRAEAAAGVAHHIALSIVGAARAPHGYYAGKALQERIVSAGGVPWTILRATQFFEFADQVAVRVGPFAVVPAMRSQPLAAEAVARRLVEIAEGAPLGDAPDVAGPEELRMAELARAVRAGRGERGRVFELPLPGGFGRAIRDGSILPGEGARLLGPRFEEWIAERSS